MNRRVTYGFTFVELSLVICFILLTAGFAVPSFINLIERNRALVVADQLQSQLAHARALSINQNRDVEVCGSSDGELCDGGWSNGWILWMPNTKEVINRYRLTSQQHLKWKGFSRTIRFYSNGTAPTGNGRFSICDGEKRRVMWQLVINRQGRVLRRTPEVEQEASCN